MFKPRLKWKQRIDNIIEKDFIKVFFSFTFIKKINKLIYKLCLNNSKAFFLKNTDGCSS